MKKLFIAISLIFATSTAIAQTSSPTSYDGVSVSYVGNSWVGAGGTVSSPSGFGVNYVHGFPIAGETPIYLEAGANVSMGFQERDNVSTTMLDLQVPVNLTYSLGFGDSFSVNPFAGLNAKYYLLGSATPAGGVAVNLFDEALMGALTHNAFHFGWQAGANFQYKKVWLGFTYGSDFTEVIANTKAYGSRFALSVGFKF